MYATKRKETIVSIRCRIKKDMPEVLYIEEKSFDFSWTENDFVHCLRQRNCIGMVAEYQKKVVGFMIYEIYEDKIQILNFAVHPDWRRQSIGTQMIKKLTDKLSAKKRKEIILTVKERNLPMQLFLRECGFKALYVLREYYKGYTSEDAYVMHINKKQQTFSLK